MQGFAIVLTAIAYVSLLFAVASVGDRRAARRGGGKPRPYIYALSLAIYCTSWTFFGSVGLASERGPEFLAIYIGPLFVFLFCFPLIRRIIRLAKAEKITSIADFLGARYGKSFHVALIATLIATVGAIPYIALQLKAISGSVSLMVEHYSGAPPSFDPFVSDISLVVAMLLAVFAVLFGTRHADATEHQDGLVLAVAVESVVKLAAFLVVGIMATFFLFDSPAGFIDAVTADPSVQQAMQYRTSLGTWVVMTTLSGFAIIMLPRQFHVAIVENRSEGELKTATWVFPVYLVAINLFVIPLAFAGTALVGDRTSADLYVLSLPLLTGHDVIAMAAFLGGLSAATAMVIVASVALSIMISNDLVIPLFVRGLLKRDTSVDGRLVEPDPQHPPCRDLRAAFRGLPLLSREHQQRAAFVDRPDVVRGDRAIRAGLLRRAVVARRQCQGCSTRHVGRHSGLGLYAAAALARRAGSADPRRRPVRHRGAAAAGAVRHAGRAAQPRRLVEPCGQHDLLRAGLAVAGIDAAGAHPGRDLRAARHQPDAEPAALPHRGHRQRPQGHDRALPWRRADRAVVPDLRSQQWRSSSPVTTRRAWA